MPMYVLTLQFSKDPKDKTGMEMYVNSLDDYCAVMDMNNKLASSGIGNKPAYYRHFKQCKGRTIYYDRGF